MLSYIVECQFDSVSLNDTVIDTLTFEHNGSFLSTVSHYAVRFDEPAEQYSQVQDGITNTVLNETFNNIILFAPDTPNSAV